MLHKPTQVVLMQTRPILAIAWPRSANSCKALSPVPEEGAGGSEEEQEAAAAARAAPTASAYNGLTCGPAERSQTSAFHAVRAVGLQCCCGQLHRCVRECQPCGGPTKQCVHLTSPERESTWNVCPYKDS